ncbi:unnamed protein product [Penicillium glandicola]
MSLNTLPYSAILATTTESSESETDDYSSKGHHHTKPKDHTRRKNEGKNRILDSEYEDSEDSEDSKIEDNDSSQANFKPPRNTQRRNTK